MIKTSPDLIMFRLHLQQSQINTSLFVSLQFLPPFPAKLNSSNNSLWMNWSYINCSLNWELYFSTADLICPGSASMKQLIKNLVLIATPCWTTKLTNQRFANLQVLASYLLYVQISWNILDQSFSPSKLQNNIFIVHSNKLFFSYYFYVLYRKFL